MAQTNAGGRGYAFGVNTQRVASATAQYVTLDTTAGAITLELYVAHAPRTCNNFFQLAARGYYDGTIFHRIIKDFMAQVRGGAGSAMRGVERGARALPPAC